jgi:hypothetical protein
MKTDKGQFNTKKKNQIMTANAQNSTFANRTSRRKTKVCKRAVFLPTLAPRDRDELCILQN